MESTSSEYPAITMAVTTGENDFPLYAYHEQYPSASNYTTSSAYAEHFYAPTTTFDSYAPQNAYAFQPQNDFYAKTTYPIRSPLIYSPANSVAPSFDLHHPSISTSDSSASVPSSISSARASPSLSTINAADWTHNTPTVVSTDSYDIYTSQTLEHETLFASEKIPGCVGESTTIPSSSIFPFSRASPSEHVSHTTIDSVFKTPGTPASVTRSPHSTSPRGQWTKGRRDSIATTPRSIPHSTTSTTSISSPSMPRRINQSKALAPAIFHHSPFFHLSSGLYAPPLDSSCLFPLYCISFPLSLVITQNPKVQH